MKKVFLGTIALCAILVTNTATASLYHKFKNKPEIKLYLSEVKSKVQEPHVKTAVFRKVFRDVLPTRVNIKFKSVSNPKMADAIIKATITKYKFNKKVMPSFFSTWALVADTAAPKSAAGLSVDYEIIDPKTNKVMAKLQNFTIDVRMPIEDMKGEKAFINAATKSINRFIYRSFYRQKSKAGLL